MKAARNSLIGLLTLFVTGCGGNAKGDSAKHPLTMQVTPPHATIWVHETKETPIAAVLEQDGPFASFDLPTGRYTYEVHAPGYEAYRGEFNLPQNKELSVWLSAQR